MLRSAGESTSLLELQKPVDRLRFEPGRLAETLRGTAGRGAQKALDFLGSEHEQDAVDEGCLADTGATGDHQYA